MGRNVVPVAAAIYACFALPISMIGVIWPEVRAEFDQSLGTLGLVSLIYGVSRMSSATTGRLFIERIGTGRGFLLAFTALAASIALLAGSPSWPVFLAAVALVGVCSGILDSIGAVFISTLGDIRSAGLIHGFYGFGATVGPLGVAVLPGWRWPLLAALGITIVVLLVVFAVRNHWPDTGTTAAEAATALAATSNTLMSPAVIVSLLLFVAFVATEVTAGQWAFTYLTEARRAGDQQAAVAVAGFWAGLMVGRLIMAQTTVSALIARLGLAKLAATAAMATGGLWVVPAAMAPVFLALIGIALAPIVPTLFATTASRVASDQVPRTSGWQLVATNVGAIAIPSLTGGLVEWTGPGIVVVVVFVMLAVFGAPLLFVLDRIRPAGLGSVDDGPASRDSYR